jgi:hypothetical protein
MPAARIEEPAIFAIDRATELALVLESVRGGY